VDSSILSTKESAEFRRIYSEALNYGFAALGKHIARIVNDYLARKYGQTPIDTYTNPKFLSEALEKSLGYGSVLVEIRIVKSLRSSLSPQMENNSPLPSIRMGHPEDFEKYVYECLQIVQSKVSK
jgi:hypothetical protein